MELTAIHHPKPNGVRFCGLGILCVAGFLAFSIETIANDMPMPHASPVCGRSTFQDALVPCPRQMPRTPLLRHEQYVI